ncbi:hypothetical protein SAMN06298216_0289 [Spirosomataceae bacterium TFI 002]|nr:hypothetical protein SAMN06298216_0289 [Spirosomataceae bacterium TFI 002]
MREKFNIIVALFAIGTVIYKLFNCIECEERFLMFDISGYAYLMIWTVIAIVLAFGVYQKRKNSE